MVSFILNFFVFQSSLLPVNDTQNVNGLPSHIKEDSVNVRTLPVKEMANDSVAIITFRCYGTTSGKLS